MHFTSVKICVVCISPVRNVFSDEDAFFLLGLSWKLKCKKLKQYHFVPVGCHCICLSQITFLSDVLFFLFWLKSHLVWSGNTLHFVAREYSVSTAEYCVLTRGAQWLVLLFFWYGFFCLTSEKVVAIYGRTWAPWRRGGWFECLGCPNVLMWSQLEKSTQRFTLAVTCRVNNYVYQIWNQKNLQKCSKGKSIPLFILI